MCGFYNVWMCLCVGFIMYGCVYVWVLQCMDVFMCGFYNVWMCLFVGCFCVISEGSKRFRPPHLKTASP